MKDILKNLSKEQIEEVIQLFNPYMDDYLYIMDLKEDYYRISKHAVERFNLPSDAFYDAINKHNLFVFEEDQPLLTEDFNLMLEGKKKSHNLHYRWLDKNKQPIWINCRGQILDDSDNKPRYLIGCINETGKKQRADNISGLLGEIELDSYIKANVNPNSSGFLMRLSIDNFGSIDAASNMSYGNHIIKNVADCINECLLEEQFLFQIVAAEYMIVDFNNHNIDVAVSLYKNIQKRIAAFIDSENYKSVFTISAGMLDTKYLLDDYTDFLKLTDFSLHNANECGNNSCYIFNPDDYDLFLRRTRITKALYHSIDNNFEGFETFYQPIVDSKTHNLIGAEALMRFSINSDNNEPERISPVEFIPLLEKTGLIIPAGRWILYEAIAMSAKMQEYIPGFIINVNISYIQVIKSNILKDILSAMKKYDLAPECIGIELTESGYLDSNPHFLNLRNGLKESGVKLILDDFGTGYSNLHCLSELNPSYIKIDRNFTNQAMLNNYDHDLMVKIIEMAHQLDLKICVEGVEKTEVLDEVTKINADYIQGYLFGRPYCKEEFYEKFVL